MGRLEPARLNRTENFVRFQGPRAERSDGFSRKCAILFRTSHPAAARFRRSFRISVCKTPLILSVELPDALKALRVWPDQIHGVLDARQFFGDLQLRVTILNSSNDGRPIIAGPGASVTEKSVPFVSSLNVQDKLQIPCCGTGVLVYDTSVVVLGFSEFSGRSICW